MDERKKCEFCSNTFKDSYKLKTHQKKAKYCLEIQGKTNVEKENVEKLLLKLTALANENSQLKVENTQLKAENTQLKSENTFLKEENAEYRKTIADIAKTPTNTTQNNLLMLTPFELNRERFSNMIKESFTKDYMIEGQKGVAKFAVDKLLRDENGKLQYVCTDPSRQIYKFKTVEGEMERDVKARKLTKSIVEELKKKAQNITLQTVTDDSDVFMLLTNNFQDINDLEEDNAEFRNTLASLTCC
jgi:hypothetical protein